MTAPQGISEPQAYRVSADPRFNIEGSWWTGVILQMAYSAVTSDRKPSS